MIGISVAGVAFVGGLAGWLSNRVVNRRHGVVFNMLIGVIGAFAGAIVADRTGVHALPGLATTLLFSLLGASLLLAVLSLFRGPARG